MSITRREFGRMLEAKLLETDDIAALSRWAYETYLNNARNLEAGLKDVLLDIARMQDSPEFEYSPLELMDLARQLTGSSGE